VDRAGIQISVREVIGAGQTPRHALAEVVAGGDVISAIAKIAMRLTRHQSAVLHDARFEFEHRRPARCGTEKILVALVMYFDWPPALLRKQNGGLFRHGSDFATKTATDLRRYNAYLGLRHPKNPRQTVAQGEAPLRGGPHGDAASRFDIG